MRNFYTLFLLCIVTIAVNAQAPPPHDQPFGKVDQADLELTACDFEKDANAEVLLSIANLYYGDALNETTTEVHKRIKIFNTNGNSAANIKIPFFSYNRLDYINGLEAETINLVDGKPEITKLDKKQMYTTVIDKESSEITFTFPNVKPGSILEYKYKYNSKVYWYVPVFLFQEAIPVRFCEYKTTIPDIFYFRPQPHISMPFAEETTTQTVGILKILSHAFDTHSSTQESETFNYTNNVAVWGLANIPSLRTDAYISSFADNVQRMGFDLVSFKPINGFNTSFTDTWGKVAGELQDDQDFGSQLNKSLSNESAVTGKAALLKTDDEKIAYIFNEVRNQMKWNGRDRWYTIDGISKAWDNKAGNATEINLILYRLLKQSGVAVYPMVVSTRSNGRADPYFTSLRQFNRGVVYIPVDSTKAYVLDASNKYNQYNETPLNMLNSLALTLKSKKTYDTLTLKKDMTVRQVILVNAEIKPGGKLEGTAQINSNSYDRINAITKYKTDGEEKFIDALRDGDNGLKISSLKFENMEIDTLPLTENIVFNLDLAGSDENYIYVKPNVLTSFKTNPFLSENRLTDIYFGYKHNYSINSVFKLPAGYKTEGLPKSVSMAMPDRSIVFKRIVAEQDGSVLVHYIIDFKRTAFSAAEYAGIHDFYKKMYELLNEQIVLKKS